MSRWILPVLLVSLTLPLFAQGRTTALVVIEGLRWQQVERGEIGGLYVLAQYGAVGLMSAGAVDEVERFALTLQTGKRWPRSATREGVQLRDRLPQLRWLTEDAARAGVRVEVQVIPPDPRIAEYLTPRQSPEQAPETLQIWWLRSEGESLSQTLERAIGPLNPERDRLLIAGVPPRGESLAPVILAGSGLPTGVLTSATTRTTGIVSDVDLAPTVLQWMGVPLRVGEHPMHVVRQEPFSTVQSLARRCHWNAQGLIPVGVLQVAGGLAAVLIALRTIGARRASRRTKLLLSVAIGALLSLPAGTVLAPYLPASLFAQYVANVLLAAAGLSLAAHWGAWEQPFRAYIRACALSALIIIADAVGGQHGVKSSMYSAYALSGIRFYGIGNELMGVLVGCALAWGLYGLPTLLRGLLWIAVAGVLATPAWGANIGGLLTSAGGLGCAWESGRATGRRLWIRCACWLIGGLLAAIAVMWLDSLSVSPSHAGEAWLRWRSEGWKAVADTFSSKALLMARVLLSPFAWGVLLAIGVALWKLRHSGMITSLWKDGQEQYLPWLACMMAAFVFNDSGFVPAAAILGVGVGTVLTHKLQEVENGSIG